jgi:hypothetical protein
VPEVLAPSLELFRCPANPLAQLGKRIAERMRVELLQPRSLECFLEYCPDRPRV